MTPGVPDPHCLAGTLCRTVEASAVRRAAPPDMLVNNAPDNTASVHGLAASEANAPMSRPSMGCSA